MGLPKRKEVPPYDQVVKLVEQLPSEEQEQLRQKLNSKTWGDRWDELSSKIRARFAADDTPIPTDDEIVAEVRAVREARKNKFAQGSN
jgi:hypothetical protein